MNCVEFGCDRSRDFDPQGVSFVLLPLPLSANIASTTVQQVICSLCFRAGLDPDELERAGIVSVYMKGDRSVIASYRPVPPYQFAIKS
jgi:hypothetical protein